MFSNLHVLPLDRVQAAWEAFCQRPLTPSMADLPPEIARLVQSAWTNGAETGAAIERERQLAARGR